MAFITYPLNNIDYTAEDAELFHCTRTSGIWAEDSFSISVTGADNNVTIGAGIAWINNKEFSGKVSALKSAEVFDLGIADSTYPRIDVIAIQYSANNNATDVVIKKGTPATNPVRPSIVRTGAIYELYLASVYRPAGATAITASNVTDLRMDKTVCGLMADSVTKVDMDAIYAQLIGLVEELEEAIQNIEVGEIVPIEKGGTGAKTAEEARENLGAAPLGYGFCETAINLGTITDEAGLTSAIANIYDSTVSRESKHVYWQGYPATGSNGWFGILTRSSSSNGSVLAWAAYDGGLIIQKTKRNDEWLPVTWVITSTNIATAKDNLGVNKSLWTGSWSSGTITVPNTADYTLFKITLKGQATVILAIKKGTYIRGVGGYPTSAATSIHTFSATISEDTWTFGRANVIAHTASGNHSSAENFAVESIVGVV